MKKPLSVLLLIRSESDAKLVLRDLRHSGFHVKAKRITSADKFRAAIYEQNWDLVLSEYKIDEVGASQALAMLHAEGKDFPLIVIAQKLSEDAEAEVFRAGAKDIVRLKNLTRLRPAVERELEAAAARRVAAALGDTPMHVEQRFRSLFENIPVAIWEEDFSDVNAAIRALELDAGEELEGYLIDHPEFVLDCLRAIKVIDVNQAALSLFAAETKADLLSSLERTFSPQMFDFFRQELLAIARNIPMLEMDLAVLTLSGQRRETSFKWAIAPGHELTKSRVLVSFVDITGRKQHERELEAIAAVGSALRSSLTQDEILERLLEEILLLLRASSGSIWLNDPLSDEARLVHRSGSGSDSDVAALSGEGLAALSIRTSDVLIARELNTDPRLPQHIRSLIPAGYSAASVPFRTADKIVGAIVINTRFPQELSVSDLRVLATIAEIGASAVHRARLHDENIQRLHRLDTLRTIDIAISSSLDLRVTLKIIVEKMVQELKVDAACVLLISPGAGRLEYAADHGFLTNGIRTSSFQIGEGYPGQAAYERRLVHIKDLNAERESFLRYNALKNENFASYLGIPLIAKGSVKGVLEVFHRSPLRIDPQWLNFLDALAGQAAIAIDNILMFDGLQRSNLDLALAYDNTLEGWSRALDLRDKETEGHTKRVTETTVKLTRAFGIHESELVHIRRGALLHDIGKMAIPDSILLKPDALTPEEWVIMRKHPQHAYDLLSPISFLHRSLDIPLCHHEKWDGSGYPRGLNGEQIPLAARIFAIVDVWDALRSDRPYRSAWDHDRALDYIRSQSGSHFDPQVVSAFITLLQQQEAPLTEVRL